MGRHQRESVIMPPEFDCAGCQTAMISLSKRIAQNDATCGEGNAESGASAPPRNLKI
jgi:hypothetical protein